MDGRKNDKEWGKDCGPHPLTLTYSSACMANEDAGSTKKQQKKKTAFEWLITAIGLFLKKLFFQKGKLLLEQRVQRTAIVNFQLCQTLKFPHKNAAGSIRLLAALPWVYTAPCINPTQKTITLQSTRRRIFNGCCQNRSRWYWKRAVGNKAASRRWGSGTFTISGSVYMKTFITFYFYI